MSYLRELQNFCQSPVWVMTWGVFYNAPTFWMLGELIEQTRHNASATNRHDKLAIIIHATKYVLLQNISWIIVTPALEDVFAIKLPITVCLLCLVTYWRAVHHLLRLNLGVSTFFHLYIGIVSAGLAWINIFGRFDSSPETLESIPLMMTVIGMLITLIFYLLSQPDLAAPKSED